MKDPLAGKYSRLYKHEFAMATLILAAYKGTLSWSQNDYEAFRFNHPEVQLIFYPHKTSAHNHHIRVRDSGSKNRELAAELMLLLDIGAGHNCTFHQKNNWRWASQIELAERRGLEFGWAEEQVRA